jgi:hypothetical protein
MLMNPMPYLHHDATPEQRDKIQAIENRADECYKLLRLLHRPRNVAVWALLTRMALEIEMAQQRYGANSPLHRIAIAVLDKCTTGFKFIADHGKPESTLIQNFNWNGPLVEDANHAYVIAKQYTDFANVFPMWHKDHEKADLISNECVRFHLPNDSLRQRQANAYQQGTRPLQASGTLSSSKKKETPRHIAQLLNDLYYQARPSGKHGKFVYQPSSEVIEALRPEYQDRLDQNFRHPDSIQLNGYALSDFKSFYVALLILCSVHEYICYPWKTIGEAVPISSLVMVKPRTVWIETLSRVSRLPQKTCETILSDLTFRPSSKAASLCLNPFVPVDQFRLAVAPQFPLASAADENILRTFSYLYPALFSAQNTEKEAAMLGTIHRENPGYHIESSIELPDKSTEIDIVIEDTNSSTVILAELKWIRKPNRTLERIAREADVEKGIRQLSLIRDYSRMNPDFLMKKGKLKQRINAYANVHYLLLVRDFWFWEEPKDQFALLDFDEFVARLKDSASLKSLVEGLLKYDWLPEEGRDFTVEYTSSSVYGVTIESPLFKPTKR